MGNILTPNLGLLKIRASGVQARMLQHVDENMDVIDGAVGDVPLPLGAIAQNMDPATVTSTFTPTSGTVYALAIKLKQGQTVSNISLLSAVGITSPTHYQFGLVAMNSSGAAAARLAQSADQTSSPWATNAVKTLAMQTPYVVPIAGTYFVAFFYTGSALTLRAAGTTDQVSILVPPARCASADAGVTALPATLAAQTGVASVPWAWVS